MSTLWNKGISADKAVENFTVGRDREMDLRLAKYDIIGSLAHVKMLESISLLSSQELASIEAELATIMDDVINNRFVLEDQVEDIHSQIEILLTRKLGDLGKKIHSGRSRNDQVLTDIKLYLKDECLNLRENILSLFDKLQTLSEKHKNVLLPGYTHGQIAMPSSFGLWFGACAETLCDDLYLLNAAYKIVDQNPLGSSAGYGNSFPLDRAMTTHELGFATLNYNSIAAQLSRGKSEKALSFAMSSIASSLIKLSADCCMYLCPNYGFISFPDNLTTGSSIMPHKKNPDVWELIRGHCNRIQALPNEISMLCTNLPHGYHRDFQLLKEILFPAITQLNSCIDMAILMLDNIEINDHILDDPKYNYLFTVEEVNKRVLSGMSFRDAYITVGKEVNNGTFKSAVKKVAHTHLGSIGNLCTTEIRAKALDAFKIESKNRD